MIAGELHDKDERVSPMTPTEAARFAYRLKRTIIDSLLDSAPVEKIVIPCVDGNHGRTTARRTPGLNQRYSHEHDVYLRLAEHYDAAGEKRVSFYIANRLRGSSGGRGVHALHHSRGFGEGRQRDRRARALAASCGVQVAAGLPGGPIPARALPSVLGSEQRAGESLGGRIQPVRCFIGPAAEPPGSNLYCAAHGPHG